MSAVHQFVATAEPGAVGSDILGIQDVVRRRLGLRSEIFAEHRRGPFEAHARHYGEYGTVVASDPGDVLVYHLAIGSVVADWLGAQGRRLVVVHHNLTPAVFLRSWDPDATYGVEWGRRQLPELARHTVLGVGDSSYNEGELIAAGYRRTTVVPVLVDRSAWMTAPLARRDDPGRGARWLFVSRLAASKSQHELVAALAAYRAAYDPDATLTLAGGPARGAYVDAVAGYAEALGLSGAVTLTGPVSDDELAAAFASADVFVGLSRHEGFGVPFVEAMMVGLPIVASGMAAVPETVADAGLVLPVRRGRAAAPLEVAAAVRRVLTDRSLRDQLVAAGQRRLTEIGPEAAAGRWAEVLGELVA